jgi:hypothetical protein
MELKSMKSDDLVNGIFTLMMSNWGLIIGKLGYKKGLQIHSRLVKLKTFSKNIFG